MNDKVIVHDVDLAKDLKDLIVKNANDITIDDALRKKVFGLNDDDLVRVEKCISSLKIMSVSVINDDYLSATICKTVVPPVAKH